MAEENKEEQINVSELVESLQAYEFFSNQVKVNIANNQGIRLILEKLSKIEEKLEIMENSQNQPNLHIENAQKQPTVEDLTKKDDLPIPQRDGKQ